MRNTCGCPDYDANGVNISHCSECSHGMVRCGLCGKEFNPSHESCTAEINRLRAALAAARSELEFLQDHCKMYCRCKGNQ